MISGILKMKTADQQPNETGPITATVKDKVRPCRVCKRVISVGDAVYQIRVGNGTRWRHVECRVEVPDPSDEGAQSGRNKIVVYHRGRRTNFSE